MLFPGTSRSTTLMPVDAYKRRWIGSPVVHLIAWRMSSVQPLHEQTLFSCQLHQSKKDIFLEIEGEYDVCKIPAIMWPQWLN